MGHIYATNMTCLTIRHLKELRRGQGLSHESLAKKAGVTRAAISHIEGGRRNPSLHMALKLAGALGVELSEVLFACAQKTAEGKSKKAPPLLD